MERLTCYGKPHIALGSDSIFIVHRSLKHIYKPHLYFNLIFIILCSFCSSMEKSLYTAINKDCIERIYMC